MKPNHAPPPLLVKNESTSILPAVDVIVGELALTHLTTEPQVIVLCVPSAVKIIVKEPPDPLAGGLDTLKVVISAFNETVNILEVSRLRVKVPAEIAGLDTVSE
jgi:hypothetical protein